MTDDQVTRLAIQAITAQLKRLALEANMHDLLGATYPAARSASDQRRRYLAARDRLQARLNQKRLPGLP